MTGEAIIESMKPMHDRSNGLGGGFAAYGIYPEYRDFFALHMFLDDRAARKNCEAFLRETMEIVREERIPTRKTPAITDEPLIWRFFVTPLRSVLASMQIDEEECVARTVMAINTQMKGVYVFSSGKNMGVFKAVGFPEDVGHFYRLEDYAAYSWTAHGRYPTNTPGWWGGAHPFALLDRSIVHNGEISSYDANRRFMEMFGYRRTPAGSEDRRRHLPHQNGAGGDRRHFSRAPPRHLLYRRSAAAGLFPEGDDSLPKARHRQGGRRPQHCSHRQRNRPQRRGYHCHRRLPGRHRRGPYPHSG